MRSSAVLSRGPELVESLAWVINRLRTQADPRSPRVLSLELLGSADVFLDRLVDHIAEEEDTVFPALGMTSSDKTPGFQTLKTDHSTMHSAARRLVIRILKGDDVIDAARVLLAQLLQHIRSEDDVTSQSLGLLGARVRMRMARAVSMRRRLMPTGRPTLGRTPRAQ